MLNLSHNSIQGKVETTRYRSFNMLKDYRAYRQFMALLIISLLIFFIVLFLPWTQNIRSNGQVTTLQLDQRPQMVHSVIAGRIEKWYVREGSRVNAGDTILHLSEIKDQYFDPDLLERTERQIKAKASTVTSYQSNINALDRQLEALERTRNLEMEQAKNRITQATLKIESDSIELEASITNLGIAEERLARMEQLYEKGLKSLTDLETRKMILQQAQAKRIAAENHLLASKNDLLNAKVKLESLDNQYQDKISQVQSKQQSVLSSMYGAEADLTKMENQMTNYTVRQSWHYIVAPQDGYVTQAIRAGIGETVKEGAALVSIMPADFDLAVTMFLKPMDMPLIDIGTKVRFRFDGWPSVVFSGWPNLSYGTFGGVIVGFDNNISDNGQYRVLVAPDPNDAPWPKELKVGSGAVGLALLKDVPIWYELWRKINGFPPDYYRVNQNNTGKMEKKI